MFPSSVRFYVLRDGNSGSRVRAESAPARAVILHYLHSPHWKMGDVRDQSRMTLLFLTLTDSAPGCGLLPVGATNSLAALKLYFYHSYTYRFLFQFSIYSFCLVQFLAVFFFVFPGIMIVFFSLYSIL